MPFFSPSNWLQRLSLHVIHVLTLNDILKLISSNIRGILESSMPRLCAPLGSSFAKLPDQWVHRPLNPPLNSCKSASYPTSAPIGPGSSAHALGLLLHPRCSQNSSLCQICILLCSFTVLCAVLAILPTLCLPAKRVFASICVSHKKKLDG